MTTLAERARAHPSNYGARRGEKVRYVVIHVTEGSAKGALAWFADPASKVSAHYVVTQAGVVWECVHEDDCAWHAAPLNRQSVGVELEGWCAKPETFTPAMLRAAGELVSQICDRHGIPKTREWIIGHNEVANADGTFGGVNHHTDPGPHMPWSMFMEYVQAKEGVA